ncbi:unnamed protein product [Pedinophyceae sp. YPF-701]|nr:unnamed protein product [Pedinophyceae sp. YPF-701]
MASPRRQRKSPGLTSRFVDAGSRAAREETLHAERSLATGIAAWASEPSTGFVRGTTAFIGSNVSSPIIRGSEPRPHEWEGGPSAATLARSRRAEDRARAHGATLANSTMTLRPDNSSMSSASILRLAGSQRSPKKAIVRHEKYRRPDGLKGGWHQPQRPVAVTGRQAAHLVQRRSVPQWIGSAGAMIGGSDDPREVPSMDGEHAGHSAAPTPDYPTASQTPELEASVSFVDLIRRTNTSPSRPTRAQITHERQGSRGEIAAGSGWAGINKRVNLGGTMGDLSHCHSAYGGNLHHTSAPLGKQPFTVDETPYGEDQYWASQRVTGRCTNIAGNRNRVENFAATQNEHFIAARDSHLPRLKHDNERFNRALESEDVSHGTYAGRFHAGFRYDPVYFGTIGKGGVKERSRVQQPRPYGTDSSLVMNVTAPEPEFTPYTTSSRMAALLAHK